MTVQEEVDKQLYAAAENGDVDTIETLFSGHPIPNIESTDDDGDFTALHAAVLKGHLAVVETLIRKGASVQAVDKHGYTAAYIASLGYVERTAPAILQLLLAKDPSLISMQHTEDKTTCLHIAASLANSTIVQFLLAQGADPTLKNLDQETAWDCAAQNIQRNPNWQASGESGEFPDRCVVVYRSFLRIEMMSGNINGSLGRIFHHKTREDLEVYEIRKANLVDLFILLEYLTYLPHLRQACQQIRRELRLSVGITNRLRYRESSCIFETQSRPHQDVQSDVLGFCDDKTYETFKAIVAEHNTNKRPQIDSFQVSKPDPVLNNDSNGGTTRSLSDSIGREPALEYLSVVMPLMTILWVNRSEDPRSEKLVGGFKYRSSDYADLQGFQDAPTLDEYCYPALPKEILARRNADQTISRSGKSYDGHPEIRVQQVWIWLTEEILIYTLQGRNYRLEDLDVPDTHIGSDKYAQVGQYLANLMDMDDCYSIFDTFQGSIVNLAEEVGSYVERQGVESMTIEEEKRFYHEINDIREELSMLNRVLSQQEEVWRTFASNIWPEIWADTQNGRVSYAPDPSSKMTADERKLIMKLIMRPRLRIQKAQRRISQLDEDAERVERSVPNQLDLKQKHAGMQEAHATAVMSTAVFGFTIITIIFTPLSFVMSLFALPVDRFQDSQITSRWTTDAGTYSTNYIGTWAATVEIVSIFLTGIAMWLALEYGLKYPLRLKLWKALKNSNGSIYRNVVQPLLQKIESVKDKEPFSRKTRNKGTSADQTSPEQSRGQESV